MLRNMVGHRPPRRVFLSYTSELRQFPLNRSFVAAAESAIIRAGDAVSSMAYLAVRDQSVATACEAAVRQCDVYVLIAGFRYGTTVRDRSRMSYTELEFKTATAADIHRLVFVLDENADGPATMFRDPHLGRRQDAFRAKLLTNNLVGATVRDPGELEIRLFHALGNLPPVSRGAARSASAPDVDAARTEALTAVSLPAAAPAPPPKRRGGRILLLAAGLAALLASVVVGVSLASSGQSRGTPAPPSPTPSAADSATNTTTAADATTADPAASVAATSAESDSTADSVANSTSDTVQKPIIDEEVTIPRLGAADIDKSPAGVKGAQVGPTGDFDLYHDSGIFRVHTGSIFMYPLELSTAPDKAYAACADYTGPSPSSGSEVPYIGATVDAPFCFVTSAHHLAWAEVVGVQDDTQAATVHVRVWDKTVDA